MIMNMSLDCRCVTFDLAFIDRVIRLMPKIFFFFNSNATINDKHGRSREWQEMRWLKWVRKKTQSFCGVWCEFRVSAYVTTVNRDSERESATAGCLLMFVEWGEIII